MSDSTKSPCLWENRIMDETIKQLEMLRDHGRWLNQRCHELIEHVRNELEKTGTISNDLKDKNRELMSRSNQWIREVDKLEIGS